MADDANKKEAVIKFDHALERLRERSVKVDEIQRKFLEMARNNLLNREINSRSTHIFDASQRKKSH